MGRGSDSQKQLWSLIRNFAAEKSQGGIHSFHCFQFSIRRKSNASWYSFCLKIWKLKLKLKFEERRVVNLRKQIEKLKSELSEANAELENAKRCKELVEQDLKGFEVQLMLTESSAQTLEVTLFLISVISLTFFNRIQFNWTHIDAGESISNSKPHLCRRIWFGNSQGDSHSLSPSDFKCFALVYNLSSSDLFVIVCCVVLSWPKSEEADLR